MHDCTMIISPVPTGELRLASFVYSSRHNFKVNFHIHDFFHRIDFQKGNHGVKGVSLFKAFHSVALVKPWAGPPLFPRCSCDFLPFPPACPTPSDPTRRSVGGAQERPGLFPHAETPLLLCPLQPARQTHRKAARPQLASLARKPVPGGPGPERGNCRASARGAARGSGWGPRGPGLGGPGRRAASRGAGAAAGLGPSGAPAAGRPGKEPSQNLPGLHLRGAAQVGAQDVPRFLFAQSQPEPSSHTNRRAFEGSQLTGAAGQPPRPGLGKGSGGRGGGEGTSLKSKCREATRPWGRRERMF